MNPMLPILFAAALAAGPGPISNSVDREAARLAAAQTDDGWSAVQALPPNTKVKLTFASGDALTLLFLSADDGSLRAHSTPQDSVPVRFARGDVRAVAVVRSNGGARAAATLAGIGAGIAIAGGVALADQHGCCGDRYGDYFAKLALGIAAPIGFGFAGFHSVGPAEDVIFRVK
jgi:hypothetical protein